MKNIFRVLTSIVLGVLVASQLFMANPAQADKLRALFGDGSVRYLSAGPVGMNHNQNALIGLLLPAVQKASATIQFVDNNGDVLATKVVTIPTDFKGAFFGVSYKLSVDNSNNIILSDGAQNSTIGQLTSSEHISVLIGLLLPAVQKVREAASRMHTATIQVVDTRTGDLNFILPFIEQAVVAKSIQGTIR